MAKTNTQKNREVKVGISFKLLRILMPMVAIAIVALVVFTSFRASAIITSMAKESLLKEGQSNAAIIGREVTTLTDSFNVEADTIQTVKFADDATLLNYMASFVNRYELAANAMYIGLDDGGFLDPSGWVPDADYIVTERDWYLEGKGKTSFEYGTPYLDSNTGGMVVSMSREIKMADGRSGVAAVDVELSGIMEEILQFVPMGSGTTMLFDGDNILSFADSSLNGTKISDYPDDGYLQLLSSVMQGGKEEVVTSKSQGNSYYMALTNVPGTTWTMVSSINEKDVLRDLNTFMILIFVILAVVVVLIAVVMLILTRTIITKPVTKLTANIERITKGDFTVEIDRQGNDEISLMNRCMSDYVATMRNTLGDMKTVTGQLSEEAGNSQHASGELNRQANEQSQSMMQIRDTMNGISESVTELANNATSLAGAVSDLTDKGMEASETMGALVEQAGRGQKDMEAVQESMKNVADSMNEMNDVVNVVDESAQKINSIVEMINSISSQTNLLSLNASIEAARAGEAGRGFAVVADEIGNLANESANATTEISAIIQDITAQIRNLSDKSKRNVEEIGQSSEAVSTAGETFAEIFRNLDLTGHTVQDMIHMMSEVNEIASSVAAISEEQSASTIEVTDTVDTVVESAEQVANESQGVDQSAQTVANSATKIGDFVSTFKIN